MEKDKCEICNSETGFDENWTEENAEDEYVENAISALDNGMIEDPSDLEPMVLCDNCYKMAMHTIPPSDEFINGMKRLGYIDD